MAGAEGIEPPTYGFGDRHSNLIELHPYTVIYSLSWIVAKKKRNVNSFLHGIFIFFTNYYRIYQVDFTSATNIRHDVMELRTTS